jgi:hypothetical protein
MSALEYGHYKEIPRLYQYLKGEKSNYFKTNFWWDIENDYFVFFGHDNKAKVRIAMDKMKEKWGDKDE